MLFVQITIMRGEINQENDLFTFPVVNLMILYGVKLNRNSVVQIYTNSLNKRFVF